MLTRRSFLGTIPALYALARETSLAATRPSHEYHVSPHGNDASDGTPSRPLKTISAAAARALPDDTITVHEGVYRERVSPPRGGTSEANRIVYRAALNETAVITGAEIIKGWKRLQGDVWAATIPNSFFATFNPYNDVLHGDWFNPKGRVHHTGAVYLNGEWLSEAASFDEVMQAASGVHLWFGHVDTETTTLWARFNGVDPNHELTEINVRQTVFYPASTGIDYITVRGFTMRCAATPWAPPTAEQVGLIGTHWSKGWIIEDNVVSHSMCSGISLGKYGDQWDNTSANSAEGYVKTIERALQVGWSKDKIGHHIIRNNTISHCEQAGIVGSLGPIFSIVTGNTIHDVHVRQLFTGEEMAGIKFHAAIDVEISHNHIYRTSRGLWLDWMAQGTHVTGNLFHANQREDVFVEVDHGPFLFDNNVFLSETSLRMNSQGGAFAHNLLCGGVKLTQYDPRMTPYMKPHSTELVGDHDNPSGDIRFFNNLLAKHGDLSPFSKTHLPMQLDGNVLLEGARPCAKERSPLLRPGFDPLINLTERIDGFILQIATESAWASTEKRKLITSDMLGRSIISSLPFEQADGAPVRIDKDYSGRLRSTENPFPGPFECLEGGKQVIPVFARRTGLSCQKSEEPKDTCQTQECGLSDSSE